MTSVDTELVLVALAAMLSPVTLFLSVLALVVGERPMRTGLWFFLGAFGLTLVVGVIGAFLLGVGRIAEAQHAEDVGRDRRRHRRRDRAVLRGAIPATPSRPEKGCEHDRSDEQGGLLAGDRDHRGRRRPRESRRADSAGPEGHLRDESEHRAVHRRVGRLCPRVAAATVDRTGALAVAPESTQRLLMRTRAWLERNARTIAAVILLLLAAILMRNGIAGPSRPVGCRDDRHEAVAHRPVRSPPWTRSRQTICRATRGRARRRRVHPADRGCSDRQDLNPAGLRRRRWRQRRQEGLSGDLRFQPGRREPGRDPQPLRMGRHGGRTDGDGRRPEVARRAPRRSRWPGHLAEG